MDLDALSIRLNRLLAFEAELNKAGGVERFVNSVTDLLENIQHARDNLIAERAEFSESRELLKELSKHLPLLKELAQVKAEHEAAEKAAAEKEKS